MFPNRMFKTVAHIHPAHQVTLSAHRSRLSPCFTETDVAILDLLNQHLNNFYMLLDQKGDQLDSSLLARGMADRFPALSRREAELCSLLAWRLNTPEIATCLFISRRTVEKHVESIFDKLDVRSREELRRKLGVESPMAFGRAP
jgi:DNA-binding CsgD family transcriptional regulator